MNAKIATQGMPVAYSYVRFSSEGQSSGTSVERQTKAAQEWAERNGYLLSTETFSDLGVSAFKGSNAAEGRLGEFLEAVESGAVPKGSILVVENLDRISREKIRKARNTLESIIDTGVDVVTLSDGRVYTQRDLDEDAMTGIMIILSFQRAHEESSMKSKRVGAAWKSNAEKVKAGTRKRTTKVPAWIEFKGETLEGGSFKVIEAKADVVREVFHRYADGEPTNTVANDLRKRGVPTLSGRGQWTGPLVYMLAREVTPYGTLLIGKGAKKERKIIDKVKDYYPRIVDEEIQRRVRHRIENGEAPIKFKDKGQTRGRLVGVLKSNEGNGTKAKRNNRSVSYVDRVTNKYVGAVTMVDQVLMDEWPEIIKAFGIETSAETEGLEMLLLDAIDTLERRLAMRSKRPNAALERSILSAEADVEEIKRNIQEASKSSRIYGAVPPEICILSIPEANQWVRRLIDEARVFREGKGVNARVAVWLRLKNGVEMSLGDQSVGMKRMVSVE